MYNTYLEHCIKMANDNIKDQSNSPKGPYVAIEINQEPNTNNIQLLFIYTVKENECHTLGPFYYGFSWKMAFF